MEEHRRTDGGRVRTAKEFVANFFPYDERGSTDKIFKTIPNDVRGPILSTWGIRGGKAALKDDDEKVRSVVHDALVAGDIDEGTFEDGVTAQILVDWIALADWWAFWRNGKLTGVAIQRALATARELELIDDRWFLANIQGRGGKLKGTDVVCDTLGKDQIVAWIRKLHESGDGSPAGLVAALGWETVLAKTAQDALLFALDAFAKKAGLVADGTAPAREVEAEKATSAISAVASASASAPTKKEEPAPAPLGTPTIAARVAHEARTEAPAAPADYIPQALEDGLSVSIPDIPVIDSADEEPTANRTIDTSQPSWNSVEDESPRLLEARAKMMEVLGTQGGSAASDPENWAPSDVPEKPSSLEWPEPPPIATSTTPKGSGPPPLPRKSTGR